MHGICSCHVAAKQAELRARGAAELEAFRATLNGAYSNNNSNNTSIESDKLSATATSNNSEPTISARSSSAASHGPVASLVPSSKLSSSTPQDMARLRMMEVALQKSMAGEKSSTDMNSMGMVGMMMLMGGMGGMGGMGMGMPRAPPSRGTPSTNTNSASASTVAKLSSTAAPSSTSSQ